MRRRTYLAVLAAIVAALGLCWIPDPQAAPRSWSATGAIQPRLSPDGESIVVGYQGAIWQLPRAGGVMRRWTSGPAWDSDPAWSPDGRQIAFLSGGAVMRMDAAPGAPATRVGTVQGRESLQFSPDGKRLLGNFSRDKGFALAWLPLEGGEPVPVLTPPAEARPFALSPDGREIAYAVHRDVAGEQSGSNGPQADLWIVSAEGGPPRKLLEFRSRLHDLAWSGRSLIATSDLGGAHHDLWELPTAPDEPARRLTSGQADENAPSVAGPWLLYADNRTGATALVTRHLPTGDEKIVAVTGFDAGRPAGRLALDVVEKGTGRPLAARVALQEEGGKPFAPAGTPYRIHGDQMDYASPPASELDLPAGRYHLHVHHGIEYRMAHLQIEVPAGKSVALKVELERWAHPQASGWYSGENHIHANYGYGPWYNTPEEMSRVIEAEGLNVANFVVANSDGDGVFDREFFRGRPDPHSTPETILYWNEEFRATLWGHLTLIDLKQLVEPIFTGFADTTNPWDIPTNADIADHTHLQGGHVNYTHPAANVKDPYLSAYSGKSLPVDVALGRIDSLDINWSYEPTLSLWYRLLNCGFRVPASAGTDCFLNRLRGRLPGADRAYVRVGGPFTYDAWVKGLKQGRSFVTNGPMIEFDSGSVIRLKEPGEAPVTAQFRSSTPIDRLELVYNGEVVASGQIDGARLSGRLEASPRLDRSGWLSVRVFAGKFQAHASPIYVEVGGRPAASKVDAEFFLAWIDRLEAQLKQRDRIPSAELRKRVEEQLNAARDVYRRQLH